MQDSNDNKAEETFSAFAFLKYHRINTNQRILPKIYNS